MLGTARLLGQTTGTALVALIFGRVLEGGTIVCLYAAAIFAIPAASVSSLRLVAPKAKAAEIGAAGR
jgi:DHA2 family multidrug resistance protein-like MFS transporter